MPKRKKDENVETINGSGTEVVDGIAGVPVENSGGSNESVAASSSGSGPVLARETITIRLDSNGRIDLAGMREKTGQKLRAAIEATPELTPGFGQIHLDSSSVPDFMVNAVYQLIGGIEQWAFARKYGPEIASIMAYRPQDIAVLSEPTKAVLAKYLPKLGKYQEETALVMALASIHIGKVQAMNEMLARQEMQRATVTEIKPATTTTQ